MKLTRNCTTTPLNVNSIGTWIKHKKVSTQARKSDRPVLSVITAQLLARTRPHGAAAIASKSAHLSSQQRAQTKLQLVPASAGPPSSSVKPSPLPRAGARLLPDQRVPARPAGGAGLLPLLLHQPPPAGGAGLLPLQPPPLLSRLRVQTRGRQRCQVSGGGKEGGWRR